ncbi:MAG: SsrA-binding protein SmpB [Dehalococcoidales bacterium]|jgi:SsrA-binding protein|nr:SsrA-binding protein SmpB [Dehalococcoidales bacterium]
MAIKTAATNRKAYHNYQIGDSVEAGIVLTGTEIKSIRTGRVSLGDAYVRPEAGELWLVNAHIARYEAGSYLSHDPRRPRKLLLHRKQIDSLTSKMAERGFTLVPLKLYIKDSIAKVEVALARGKKLYDKRESITRRETEREIGRAIKSQKYQRR